MEQLVKNRTVNLTSAPSSPQAGDTYYDSFLGALRVYNGSIWLTLRPLLPSTNEFRLTLEQGVPVSMSDQTAKATVYCCPLLAKNAGNILMLSDGANVVETIGGEFAMVLPTMTNDRPHDVFAFRSVLTPSSTNTSTDILTFGSAHGWATGTRVVPTTTGGGLTGGTVYFFNAASSTTGSLHGTLANAIAGTSKTDLTASITSSLTGVGLEVLAWTNSTTRATAIVGFLGFRTKSGDETRRLMGTLHSSSTTTTEDSEANRLLWNADNRVLRKMKKVETTGSWTYNSTTWREVNGATNRVSWIDGLGESPIDLHASAMFAISTANTHYVIGIGYDSTTTSDAELGAQCGGLASLQAIASARLLKNNPLGYHYAAAVERCGSAGGNVTIFSNDTRYRTGILGTILN